MLLLSSAELILLLLLFLIMTTTSMDQEAVVQWKKEMQKRCLSNRIDGVSRDLECEFGSQMTVCLTSAITVACGSRCSLFVTGNRGQHH